MKRVFLDVIATIYGFLVCFKSLPLIPNYELKAANCLTHIGFNGRLVPCTDGKASKDQGPSRQVIHGREISTMSEYCL
jgi:hypothetical protein